ncbi:MAG: PDZ domain-containing protein [Bacteroidetes bacterium]|nr:PDZ domain-containing protein [Bacteroidota bacterium]
MKNKLKFAAIVFLLLFTSFSFAQQKFYVDLNDRANHLFNVTLIPEKLTDENKIYQFASTAPGTYQTMDIGRFVRTFKALDANGNELATKHVSVNQWELSEPAKTAKIVYSVADTWNTKVTENMVYPMCGTTIENDNVLLNGQCVFGYFHGMQKTPIEIKLDYPTDWTVGTALKLDSNGFYDAPDYDYIVDSPILLGKLTKATSKVENTTVDVYTYSKSGEINSEQVLQMLEDILSATSQFTEGLPVDRYTFLFHFENFSAGAWEHNYSSEYVIKDGSLDDNTAKELKSMAAHEFYHIVTPLNIHSELISNFNFEKPTMSQHLWLYEGVTEWAARILQLRDYLMSLDDYLADLREKISMNDNYDPKVSLVDLSLHSTEMQDQYGNIYKKGAVVATLLDIRLLELSHGKKGLREVINQLYRDYGANKPFSEKDFFDEFVKRTYPEIADFINKYIKGTEPLPIKEYFAKLGINYQESAGIDSSKTYLGLGLGVKNNKLIVNMVDNPTTYGIQKGDYILKINGDEITLQNAQQKFSFIRSLKVGDSFAVTVDRNGEQKDLKLTMQPRPIKHLFKVLDNPAEAQLELRSAWMKNL